MAVLAMFAALVALVLINVPIAVAIAVVAISGSVLLHGTGDLLNLAITMYKTSRSDSRRRRSRAC